MIAALAAIIPATSCSGSDEETGVVQEPVPISLTVAVVDGPEATRAEGNGVQGGLLSQHSMFYTFFPTGVTIGRTTAPCGTAFTNHVTNTLPDHQPYFNDNVTETVVHAYYPYLTDGKQVTNATTSFSVETDQSTSEGYHASDLMYAAATVQKATPSAELAFNHQLSRIIVKLTAGGIVDVPVNVKLNNTMTTAAISNGRLTATPQLSNKASINIGTVAVNGEDSYLSAIVIPQTLAAGNIFMTITLEGIGSYVYQIPQGGMTFKSGESYTYSLMLSTGQIRLLSTSIAPWYGEGEGEKEGHVIDERDNPLTF